MRRPTYRHRGFIMTAVLAVMGLVAGVLAVLAYCSATYYREHQAERVHLVTQAATDSVIAYARTQAPSWSAAAPTEAIPVDIAALLPPGASGSASIALTATQGRRICHVSVHVARGRYGAASEIDLALSPPPATPSRPTEATATAPGS